MINMGLKIGGVVFYENKVYGCLVSIKNVCENLMNMMQNLCQKDPPKTPHLVSSSSNHKTSCVVKTFHIFQPPRNRASPPISTCTHHMCGGRWGFFVSLGVQPSLSASPSPKAPRILMQEPCQLLFT